MEAVVIGLQELTALMRGETITVGHCVVKLDWRWLEAFHREVEAVRQAANGDVATDRIVEIEIETYPAPEGPV